MLYGLIFFGTYYFVVFNRRGFPVPAASAAESPGVGGVPFTRSAAEAAGTMEAAFENFINDVPMTALCHNIEIDQREMLNETPSAGMIRQMAF